MADEIMTDEIKVRRAQPEDLERAAQLAARLVRQHHAVDAGRFFMPDNVERGYLAWFRQELGRREAVILVATSSEPGGEIVLGYCYGTLEGRDFNLLLDRHGAIHDVYVDDAVRRRGAGRLLLEAMLRELEG